MNEKYFPFNSVNGDRKFKAEDWANYFNKTLTNGVFPHPSTGLKIISNNNMTLTVSPGSANIDGYFYTLFDNKTIRIEAAGATTRTDIVVLRWSKLNRNISIEILKNEVNRLWNEEFKDLILAKITVKALTDTVIDADITDTRLSRNCGIVNSLMQADTEEIFRQYESWFNINKAYYDANIQNWTDTKQSEFENWTTEKQNEFTVWSESEKEKFIIWLEDMKGILDNDAVGNIINRINVNAEKINQNTEQLLDIEQKVTDKIIEFEGNNSQIINEFKEYVEKKISSVIDEFSFNENGFQKFSNNFIIQWGILNGGVSQTIAFPVAFNHTCFGVQYVQQNGTSSYSCSINDVNNISFKFSTQAARSNVWAWVAIGY